MGVRSDVNTDNILLTHAQTHLDMPCLPQQLLIKPPNLIPFALLALEINVSLPHNLGHIQLHPRRDLKHALGALSVPKHPLQLREPNPGLAVCRVPFQKLLIECPGAVELAEFELELNVAPIKLFFGTGAQRHSQGFPSERQVFPSDEVRSVEQPDLAECELLVRDDVEAGLVDLFRSVKILSTKFGRQ